jgi:hypothetical protein
MTSIHETLVIIDAHGRRPFYSGLVLFNDRVIEGADTLSFMLGWSLKQVRDYALACGWRCTVEHDCTGTTSAPRCGTAIQVAKDEQS